MPRVCIICTHPNRTEIETAIDNRLPFRNIATEFNLTPSGVFRHKAHQVEALASAASLIAGSTPELESNPENLTGKRLAFIDHYFGDAKFVGIDAARLAGFEGNDNVLAVTASRLLKDAKVGATIAVRFQAMHVSADEVIAEISKIARAPWNEFIAVKTKDGQTVSVQMALRDKLKALELAGKNLGVLADVVIQERVVVFAQTVYQRLGSELQSFGLSDNEVQEFLLPILELKPEQVSGGAEAGKLLDAIG